MKRKIINLPMFSGMDTGTDPRDVGAGSPRLDGLLVGPNGGDLRTAPGVVRLETPGAVLSGAAGVAVVAVQDATRFDGVVYALVVWDRENPVPTARMAVQVGDSFAPAHGTVLHAVPWAEENGPKTPPWIAVGAGLVVFGHGGCRPHAIFRGEVFPAGIKELYGVSKSGGLSWYYTDCGANYETAAYYDYVITGYDSTLARSGEYSMLAANNVGMKEGDTIAFRPVISGAGENWDGELMDRFDVVRIWERVHGSGAEFTLVGEVTPANIPFLNGDLISHTRPVGGGIYSPDRNIQSSTVLKRQFAMPSFNWVVFHNSRFWGLGLPGWRLPGTKVRVANLTEYLYNGTVSVPLSAPDYAEPFWFGRWMNRRTIMLKHEGGDEKYHPYLISGVTYNATDEGAPGDFWMLNLAEPTTISTDIEHGASVLVDWYVAGAPNTIWVGQRILGNAEMFVMDGTCEITINEGDGQYIVCGLPLGQRLIVYKNNSVYGVTGGMWADAEDNTPVENDLDYYLIVQGVGIVGAYAVCQDGEGNHWWFDGNAIWKTDGVSAMNATGDRLQGSVRGLDRRRMDGAVMSYDPEYDRVILSGLYGLGQSAPEYAVALDLKSGALGQIVGFAASAGTAVQVRG